MRGDRQSTYQNPENETYYGYEHWEDQDIGHSYSHENRHHHRGGSPRRVGRQNDQLTPSSSRINPRNNGFGSRRRDDDDTGDGSSIISYSSEYVPQQHNHNNQQQLTKNIGQNNNRSANNYYEPTVRVHYITTEDGQGGYYSPSHPEYPSRMPDIPERFRDEKDESEMYVTDSTFRKQRPPGSIYSHYSGNKSRAPSELSSVKTKTSRKGGVVVETMAAPNPFCPNTKGVCCLMVLVNLGLILVTLGFSIVLQLYDPPFVWYCGIAFLIVGFIGLAASLIFCVYLCRESRERAHGGPGELYWTHHWQKRIPIPGMGGGRSERGEKDDLSTVYSARTDYDDRGNADKFYVQNEKDRAGYHRDNMTPIHSSYRS